MGPHCPLTPRVRCGMAHQRGTASVLGLPRAGLTLRCARWRGGVLLCVSPVPVTPLPASAPAHEARWDEVSPENPLPTSLSPSPATRHRLHRQRSTKKKKINPKTRKAAAGPGELVALYRWDYLNFSLVTLWLGQPRPEQSGTAGNKFTSPCPVLQVFQDYGNLCAAAAFSQRGLCAQYGRLRPLSVIYVHNFEVIGRT